MEKQSRKLHNHDSGKGRRGKGIRFVSQRIKMEAEEMVQWVSDYSESMRTEFKSPAPM